MELSSSVVRTRLLRGDFYYQQLRYLKLYSLQRRRERFMIIYVWRIVEGQVPNVGSRQKGIRYTNHIRRGRTCIVGRLNKRAPCYVRHLKDASVTIHGTRLFNLLPADIRNLSGCNVDRFKNRLDRYLERVPDEPQIHDYTAQRRAESNSLIDMAKKKFLMKLLLFL